MRRAREPRGDDLARGRLRARRPREVLAVHMRLDVVPHHPRAEVRRGRRLPVVSISLLWALRGALEMHVEPQRAQPVHGRGRGSSGGAQPIPGWTCVRPAPWAAAGEGERDDGGGCQERSAHRLTDDETARCDPPPFGGFSEGNRPRNLRLPGGLGENDRASTTPPRASWIASERLAEPDPGDERAGDRLEHRDDPDPGRAQVPQRAHEQEERHDRPEDDHPGRERPNR